QRRAPQVGGVADHVVDQPPEAIDEVVPRPALVGEAAPQQVSVGRGQGHGCSLRRIEKGGRVEKGGAAGSDGPARPRAGPRTPSRCLGTPGARPPRASPWGPPSCWPAPAGTSSSRPPRRSRRRQAPPQLSASWLLLVSRDSGSFSGASNALTSPGAS